MCLVYLLRRYLSPVRIPIGLFGLILILLGSGCQTLKYVPEESMLVEKNRVEVQSKSPREQRALESELGSLINRPPNSKVLGSFRTYLWFHYRVQERSDTSWFGRFIRQNISEEPVYVDTTEIAQNLENMLIYLRNRGYFQAEGQSAVEDLPEGPLANVIYQVQPGKQLTIDQVTLRSRTPELAQWIPELQRHCSIRKGQPLNAEGYNREVNRITRFLRNQGYVFFFPSQVSPYQVIRDDTTDASVNVVLELLPDPTGRQQEQVRIRDVNILTSRANQSTIGAETRIHDVLIREESEVPFLRPQVIYRSLELRPDSLYRQRDFERSNRRLTSLGVYRFVNMRTVPDSVPDRVNLNIQLTPSKQKAWDVGFEVSNTTAIGDNSNVVGFNVNNTLTHRNLFRRAIRMELLASPGVELNFQPLKVNSANVIGQLGFQFPFFEDYFGFWRGRKEQPRFRQWYPRFANDARSRLQFSYSYNLLFQYWETQLMEMRYGFTYNPNANLRFTLDHFHIEYYRNILKDRFLSNIDPDFLPAFENQFFTGFLFRNMTFEYNALPNRFGETWSAKASFEQSGLEILAINQAAKWINPSTGNWKVGNLSLTKYLRTDGQVTYARTFRPGQQVATRFYAGLIVPLADTRANPYIKQFSAGGPSSMRGWFNGELGPGGTVQDNDIPPFFQRGDLKLEANIEWRQNIFWLLEGAVFIDAGNVWNLRETDAEDPGGLRDFHKEIAIASGIGVRLKFPFFAIVYDMGAKVRYPYRVDGSYWARSLDVNFFNLLINYPF